MKKPFRERIKEGPMVGDGAMGTLLDLHGFEELPHEIQNVKNPEVVEKIHREYIAAGSEIIETNTFSANRLRLSQFHLQDQLKAINLRGVEIARRAAGDDVYVAGSVGPTGMLLEPIGKIKRQQARDSFREQIELLIQGGVDLIMLETFVSVQELDEALEIAKELTDVPIVAQKAFAEDGAILSGSFPIDVINHLIEQGADVVGANCTVGPQRMFTIIRNAHTDGVVLSAPPPERPFHLPHDASVSRRVRQRAGPIGRYTCRGLLRFDPGAYQGDRRDRQRNEGGETCAEGGRQGEGTRARRARTALSRRGRPLVEVFSQRRQEIHDDGRARHSARARHERGLRGGAGLPRAG